jgi:geranylgeranyl diphosphate synthase type II
LAPAILGGADETVQSRLAEYGEAIGLAFQIADDILDIEGGAEIGKDVGSDLEKGKSTYPSLLGLDGAKAERSRMLEVALSALKDFDDKAWPLRELARFIVERKK